MENKIINLQAYKQKKARAAQAKSEVVQSTRLPSLSAEQIAKKLGLTVKELLDVRLGKFPLTPERLKVLTEMYTDPGQFIIGEGDHPNA